MSGYTDIFARPYACKGCDKRVCEDRSTDVALCSEKGIPHSERAAVAGIKRGQREVMPGAGECAGTGSAGQANRRTRACPYARTGAGEAQLNPRPRKAN